MRIHRTLLNNPVPRTAVIYQIIREDDRTFKLERIKYQAFRRTVYIFTQGLKTSRTNRESK